MNRALVKLLLLNNRATWRRTLRGVKTVRGAFLLLFTLGFFALMIGPQVMMAVMMGNRPELHPFAGATPPFATPALIAFTLLVVFTSAGEAAVYFAPAEVDFLFSAPFTRRDLLYYKLARTGVALLVMSAFFCLMMVTSFHFWLWAYVGILLSLAMVQLVGMATALAGQLVTESAYTRARKIVLLVIAVVVLAGLADLLRRTEGQSFREILDHLRQSAVFRVLLAPFDVFTRVIFAERWYPDFLGWGAAALAIDATLLLLVLKLDANYIESAATISQKVYERIRRTKQGGGVAMPVGATAGRLRLPPFPWLAGAGPIAWRQTLLAMRTARHMLIMTLILAVTFGTGFVLSAKGGQSPGPGGPTVLPAIAISMVFYLTFIFSMQLPWAFRGDLDHIDFLKTLPVRPTRVAAGELAGGVLILTGIQVILFGLITALEPANWPILLGAAVFSLPFNVLLLSLNNILFLIYPVRMPGGTTFDIQMMGRMMLFMFLQFLLLIPLVGIPALVGLLAYFLSGYSWTAFAITSWLVLMAELVPLVLGVAWAFQRFDISTETPRDRILEPLNRLGPVPPCEWILMHPALWKLLRLTDKASWRTLFRGARTVRGALLLIFLIGIAVLYAVFLVGITFFMRGRTDFPDFTGSAAPYLPLILLAIFLQAVLGSRGTGHLYFSPAEIAFLFAGPFHRRDLLLYKLIRRGLALVVGSLIISVTPVSWFLNGSLSAFVGLSLALVFVNLASLAATLARLIVEEAAQTRIRKMVLLAVSTLVVVALPQTFSRAPVIRVATLVAGFRETWPGRVLLAPFEVFSNAMLAERWFPELVGWALAAAAMDLALLVLVLRLDADYLEWSTAISQRAYEQIERMRRSGGFAINFSQRKPRFRIPQLPWLGGAGPIAWRQMVLTARISRGMVRMILMISIFFLIWRWAVFGQSPNAPGAPGLGVGAVTYISFLFIMAFPISFRGDIDHLDLLKTLPIRPLALAAGELTGCAVVLTSVQLAVLAIYGAATASVGFLLPAAAVMALPCNAILLAASNLAFLIYPVRRTQGTSADLNMVGRALLSFLIQFLILLPVLGIAAGLAGVAYLASGFSWPVMIASAFLALLLELVPMTMLVAWAFDRYDPSIDTPAS